MTTLTNIEEARSVAQKAARGPWAARDYGDYQGKLPQWYLDTTTAQADYYHTSDGTVEANHWDNERAERDFKFMAYFNPKQVLEMLDELEHLRGIKELWMDRDDKDWD